MIAQVIFRDLGLKIRARTIKIKDQNDFFVFRLNKRLLVIKTAKKGRFFPFFILKSRFFAWKRKNRSGLLFGQFLRAFWAQDLEKWLMLSKVRTFESFSIKKNSKTFLTYKIQLRQKNSFLNTWSRSCRTCLKKILFNFA